MTGLASYYTSEWNTDSLPLPKGWSNNWTSWPLLFSLFGTGPFSIILQQMQALVHVKYKIPGEIRPVAYNIADPNKFIFKGLQGAKTTLYMGDCTDMTVSKFSVEGNQVNARKKLEQGEGVWEKLTEDEEGKVLLKKIVEGGKENDDVLDLLWPSRKDLLINQPRSKRVILEVIEGARMDADKLSTENLGKLVHILEVVESMSDSGVPLDEGAKKKLMKEMMLEFL